MHVGERVQLSEHTAAQYFFRYDNEPLPDENGRVPGWYNFAGFRSSLGDKAVSGPHKTLKDAMVADGRYRLDSYMPYSMALNRGTQPLQDFGALIINRDKLRLGYNVRIDSATKLEAGEGMLIGNNVHVASYCHLGIGGGLTILEDGSSFGSGAKVISGSNVPGFGRGCSAVDPAAIFSRSYCIVRKNATLFAGAVALPGVVIGENAVLAAYAVATKDVPANAIYGGVPAKKIGEVM